MKNSKRCEGFTLIEVLVASAIMISVFLMVFQIFSSSLWKMQRAEKASRLILVQKELVADLSVADFQHQKSSKGVLEGVTFLWRVSRERRQKVGKEVYILYDVFVELLFHKKKETFSMRQVRRVL